MKKFSKTLTAGATAAAIGILSSGCESVSDPTAKAFEDKAFHAGALVLNADAIVRDGCGVKGEGSNSAAGENSGNAILKLGPKDKIVIPAPKGGFETSVEDVIGNNGEHVLYRHWVKLPKDTGRIIASQMDWNTGIHKDPVGSNEFLSTLIDEGNFENACVGDNYELVPPMK